ncbi:hypothetical protein POM88_000811 [Heracleum sosnowskyi]|uniref:Transposase n=1 Tax=Heracleum sosnowskyi TaxID=360622 RepID=A0AAD8NA42_9APIA|nr:hypothetical protein POM88_000811 [Heracleum sosnowskyi]
METGRPYKYLTDDKERIQVACAKGCPFKMWASYIKELLISDLDLQLGFEKTLISNQQKGLDKAIRELLLDVEHRFCTRHLASNLTKVYPSSAVTDAFWAASTATHPQAFKAAMRELERVSKGAAEKMKQLNPAAWSKAHFSTHSMTDNTENNMSECFNSWILKTRYMPLIDMLTEIHDMLMTRLHHKRDWMAQRDCVIVPVVKKNLDIAVKDSVGFTVLWDERENYVVKGRGVTTIQVSRQNPIDFVAKWYTKDCFMRTYSYSLEPIKGEAFGEDVEGDNVLPPLIVKKLRGRPKKLRRREGWEGSVTSGKKVRMSYRGRVMHCGICKQTGHNKSKCPTAGDAPPQPQKKR